MDVDFIRRRITELRISRGVSEYKMSLDLGHSRSYMQSIASGRMMPSMSEFLYICEYLDVTPREFFDEGEADSPLVQKAVRGLRRLDDKDVSAIIGVIDRLQEKNKGD